MPGLMVPMIVFATAVRRPWVDRRRADQRHGARDGMTTFFASIGLPEIVAGLMVLALNAYVLMGGADFGGGLWDLLAAGPRREAQRELIAGAIAPIWEANHVWLIVVVVLLFTAFPVAFATLGIVLHVPLAILLLGIVMRGAAFIFRSYGSRTRAHRRRWGLAFAIASTITPVLLGIVVGAVASGDVAAAAGMVSSVATPFGHIFIEPWLSPFPVAVGCFALALFAFLAAVYLALAAQDAAVQDDFRRRALAMAAGVFVCAFVALLLARSAAPRVAAGVIGKHVGTRAAPVHGRRGAHGDRRTLATRFPCRADCRGGAGQFDPVGLGRGTIPISHSPHAHHPSGGGAGRDARAAACRVGGWHSYSDSVAQIPVQDICFSSRKCGRGDCRLTAATGDVVYTPKPASLTLCRHDRQHAHRAAAAVRRS